MGAGALLGVLFIALSIRCLRRRRLLDDIPTSKADGVFIGFVELKGRAELDPPLESALAEEPCVWYSWSVEERWSRMVTETYTDAKGQTRTRMKRESGWETVAQGGETSAFLLRDDTGAVLVQPDGATIEGTGVFDETCGPGDGLYYGKGPPGAVAHSDHVRRFHETAIPVGAALYVVGQAREREDIVAPEIAHDAAAPMFLVTMRTERQVGRGYMAWAWFLGILGLALAAAGFAMADPALQRVEKGLPVLATSGATGYLAAWSLAWVWMVYNAMVNLRQRVRQAWSLVEVELKRRNDLIPNLVRAVEGLRDHERTLQAEVADLRGQLGATPPGRPGPDHHAVVPSLRVIVERYPELKAQQAFLNLQEELSETEQRIALARAYFNDIATFYNTRLEVVPDGAIARLGGMRPEPLMTASDFERAPVAVRLAPGQA